jgi:hypothetical protein
MHEPLSGQDHDARLSEHDPPPEGRGGRPPAVIVVAIVLVVIVVVLLHLTGVIGPGSH